MELQLGGRNAAAAALALNAAMHNWWQQSKPQALKPERASCWQSCFGRPPPGEMPPLLADNVQMGGGRFGKCST
eukprot:352311-Chlamydomonas_euryale.AAC.2